MTDSETIIYMIPLQTKQVLFSTSKTLLYILSIYWNGLYILNVIIELHKIRLHALRGFHKIYQ